MADQETAFEYTFEQVVKASKLERFHVLNDKLRELASRQPGFIHQERREVQNDGRIRRFQTKLKFDTAEHCVSWLENPERRRLLNIEEQEAGYVFRGHANWGGYSRWLSRRVTGEAPKWKVNLLVLLTLYPTAMLLTPLLHMALGGIGLPVSMFVSNILCVAATSWVLVPCVSGICVHWLNGELKGVANAAALAGLLVLMAIMVIVFQLLPASFWG